MIAPDMSWLAEEEHKMAGSPTAARKEHHNLSMAVSARQEENIAKLKNVFRSFMNPITYEGEDLTNIITKVVMPVHVQKDVCNQDEIGQEMYAKYVVERINTNEVSVWARMKKVQLKMWKGVRKTVKHRVADQVVELKDQGPSSPAC